MKINLNKPENFTIGCKSCGSYVVDLYLDIDDSIVLDCANCENEEEI